MENIENNEYTKQILCEETKSIELRSEEVQEILSRPPHAMVRYGISIICSIIVISFVGSFFFCYPDFVTGDVVITTEHPPVWLIAQSTGKIKELFCKDKQIVNQGEILAVIDNPAKTSDVLTLKNLLSNTCITDSSVLFPTEIISGSYELGSIQPYFSAFTKAITNYNNFIKLNLTSQAKSSLTNQIYNRKIYSNSLLKQVKIKEQELKLSKSAYERDKQLFSQKVIAKSEFENSEQIYLIKQEELQQLNTSVSLQNIESTLLKESINKLSLQYLQENQQLKTELSSTHRELLAAIINWQQSYLLIVTQNGQLTFNSFWKSNQHINIGDKVFAIVPFQSGKLIGKIQVPVTGSGKVNIGQQVNIKVSGYPYMEFGLLKGKVTNISLVANNDIYTVEVEFPNGLRTSVNKKLKFKGELIGTAEIITENRSLIERIFTPVKYLINRYSDY